MSNSRSLSIGMLIILLAGFGASIGIGAYNSALISGMQSGGSQTEQINLNISGSTTVFPIVNACAPLFMAQYSNYDIRVSAGGSSTGVKNAGLGVSDIGMASRAVKSSENESYNYELKQWAVANDGIALILSQNLATVGINNLTIDEIFLIYNTTYLYWDDIPRHAWTGHHVEIESVIRSAASGTRASFDELVEYSVTSEELGENLGFITNIGEHNEQLENPGVRDFVQNTDNAIGYVGLGFIGTNLNAAVSENGVDFYQATPDTVKAEQYPIARKLYLVTLGLPTANALAFMNFIYGPIGQQIAADQGFVPLYVSYIEAYQ